MAYEKRHGIWVSNQQKRLRLFIDETYLDNHSGVIQTGLIFPDEWYTKTAVPQARDLLGQRKEFKGGRLSTKNRKSYETFLALFAAAAAQVGATNELRSIIAIDGASVYDPTLHQIISDASASIFATLPPAGLLEEFANQYCWLVRHGQSIVRTPIGNPLGISFDAKQQHGKLSRVRRAMKSNIGPIVLQTPQDLFTRLANLSKHNVLKDNLRVGTIDMLDFRWSHTEAGLQAADVFANFTHAALRYELGSTDSKDALKHEVLTTVIDGFSIDPALKGKLRLTPQGIECTEPTLCSSWKLDG